MFRAVLGCLIEIPNGCVFPIDACATNLAAMGCCLAYPVFTRDADEKIKISNAVGCYFYMLSSPSVHYQERFVLRLNREGFL